MSSNSNIVIQTPGFFSILFLILMTLKLTGYIALSWWLITAPLWAPTVIVIGVIIILLLIWFIAEVIGRLVN